MALRARPTWKGPFGLAEVCSIRTRPSSGATGALSGPASSKELRGQPRGVGDEVEVAVRGPHLGQGLVTLHGRGHGFGDVRRSASDHLGKGEAREGDVAFLALPGGANDPAPEVAFDANAGQGRLQVVGDGVEEDLHRVTSHHRVAQQRSKATKALVELGTLLGVHGNIDHGGVALRG